MWFYGPSESVCSNTLQAYFGPSFNEGRQKFWTTSKKIWKIWHWESSSFLDTELTSTVKPIGWESVDNEGFWLGRNSNDVLVIANCSDLNDPACVIKTLGTRNCVTGTYTDMTIAKRTEQASYGCPSTEQGTVLIIPTGPASVRLENVCWQKS